MRLSIKGRKGRKRCPICNSVDIYKRSRRSWPYIRNLEKKAYISHKKIKIKIYVCRNCKYEFDVPIVNNSDKL